MMRSCQFTHARSQRVPGESLACHAAPRGHLHDARARNEPSSEHAGHLRSWYYGLQGLCVLFVGTHAQSWRSWPADTNPDFWVDVCRRLDVTDIHLRDDRYDVVIHLVRSPLCIARPSLCSCAVAGYGCRWCRRVLPDRQQHGTQGGSCLCPGARRCRPTSACPINELMMRALTRRVVRHGWATPMLLSSTTRPILQFRRQSPTELTI
jgi:hypothetical protein